MRVVRREIQRMTFFASLAPQKVFGFGGVLGDPFRRRQHAIICGDWSAREIAIRLAQFAQLGGMRGDVGLELCDHECVDSLRRVVRHLLREALIKLQRVARCAGCGVCRWSHGGADYARPERSFLVRVARQTVAIAAD